MNFMKVIFTCLFIFCVSGCGGRKEQGHHHGELEAHAVTQWSDQVELFVEFDPLIAGKETAFAVHLTDLNGFKPVTEGKVTLTFSGPQQYTFTSDAPSSPGIFRPVAKIIQPGKYDVVLALSGAVESQFDIDVEVFSDEHSAIHGQMGGHEEHGHEHGGHDDQGHGHESAISFLKEQQWKGEFNVEEVKEKELFEALITHGYVRAPLEGAKPIAAPASGTLSQGSGSFPLLGSAVTQGQVLAEIQSGENIVQVIAPINGIVSVVHTAPGDTVEKGRKLLDLVDLQNVWIEARVYEQDVPKLTQTASSVIEVSESSSTIESQRLVSIGGMMDTVSRSIPVIFEVKNPDSLLKIGSGVKIYIRTKKAEKTPVVPVSALVDEDGRMTAYVQLEGEAFEKREVQTGVREGNFVQALEGLEPGERVVTQGAYLIKLTSVSSQVPSHGHVH